MFIGSIASRSSNAYVEIEAGGDGCCEEVGSQLKQYLSWRLLNKSEIP